MNGEITYNPYDFANPVSDASLFVGRESELAEIRYYLDHAKEAPRPINLALLGPRAAGKTSLLNMIELEAEKRGQCPVRIDLDEDDATSQLAFFFKVFDSIMAEVCKREAFGGVHGKTFDTYLEIVNSYSVPDDKTFCPLVFPIQYAKAMSGGNREALLSDTNYKRDLAAIRSELSQPIILLFDEGNVLANSRSLLEKLRNIFMNIPGFMLVLTGTPELFPVIDEVFSPIVRQFKKINVVIFKDEDETKECIRKPLERMGVQELFEFENYAELLEIHSLSGGRPYEIQLICFFMFKRVQLKRAKKMKLDLNILEEVRKELETTQDISARPLLTLVRNLDNRQLAALSLFCAWEGKKSFDQVWFSEFAFRGEQRWTQPELRKYWEAFQEIGLLASGDDAIDFAGDDFDKIYTKYFAREEGIPITFANYPMEIYWYLKMRGLVGRDFVAASMPTGANDFLEIASKLNTLEDSSDVFVDNAPVAEWLYSLMIQYRNVKEIPLLICNVGLPWFLLNIAIYCKDQRDPDRLDAVISEFEELKARTEKVSGHLSLRKTAIAVTPVEILADKVQKSANARLRSEFASNHVLEMISDYMESKQSDPTFYGLLSLQYEPDPPPDVLNNVAYVLMSTGELEKAKTLFVKCQENADQPYEQALSAYNLGILEAYRQNFEEAHRFITRSIERAEMLDEKDRICMCLFVPIIQCGSIRFQEERDTVDLLQTAIEAESVITTFLNGEKDC